MGGHGRARPEMKSPGYEYVSDEIRLSTLARAGGLCGERSEPSAQGFSPRATHTSRALARELCSMYDAAG